MSFIGTIIESLRKAESVEEVGCILEHISAYMGFRYYALIHHIDLRNPLPGVVDIKKYPEPVVDRLFASKRYCRDAVFRGCIFADSAFLWSELGRIISLDPADNEAFEFGARFGLNEGITVPCFCLGERLGSCTFAGTLRPDLASRYLGVAQAVGIFSFQAARRLNGRVVPARKQLRLGPRPRDCVLLCGRGYSIKAIARALDLSPRTVDGYLTEARAKFGAHGKTELVVAAILAGEIGIDEVRPRQPE